MAVYTTLRYLFPCNASPLPLSSYFMFVSVVCIATCFPFMHRGLHSHNCYLGLIWKQQCSSGNCILDAPRKYARDIAVVFCVRVIFHCFADKCAGYCIAHWWHSISTLRHSTCVMAHSGASASPDRSIVIGAHWPVRKSRTL